MFLENEIDKSIELNCFISQHNAVCTHATVKASNLTAYSYIYLSVYLVVYNEHLNRFAK